MKDIRMNKILTLIIIVQWAPLIDPPPFQAKWILRPADPITGISTLGLHMI